MIELVVRDLRHEIEAYDDFCEFRRTRAPQAGVKLRSGSMSRDEWLEKRRAELQSRMRRRRRKSAGKTSGRVL